MTTNTIYVKQNTWSDKMDIKDAIKKCIEPSRGGGQIESMEAKLDNFIDLVAAFIEPHITCAEDLNTLIGWSAFIDVENKATKRK